MEGASSGSSPFHLYYEIAGRPCILHGRSVTRYTLPVAGIRRTECNGLGYAAETE